MTTAEVQSKLRFLCYYNGAVDGINGSKTKSATVNFQKTHGLTADGIAGTKTNASLLANYNWHWKHDSSIKMVQRLLKYMYYSVGTIDGIKGTNTTNAIKKFQKDHSLTADGIVGTKTWASLKTNYNWHLNNDGKKATVSTTSVNVNTENMSKHFKRSEFSCPKYCNGYPHSIDANLIKNLESVRTHFGKPVTITSGLRCYKYNKSLKGSIWNSKHRYGKAADIYIPGVTTTAAGRAKVKAYWYTLSNSHYCYYGTSNMGNAVHVDVN